MNRLVHDTQTPEINLNDNATALRQERITPHFVTAIKIEMKIPSIVLNDPITGDSMAAFAHRMGTDERLSQLPAAG